MENLELLTQAYWQPFKHLGLTHTFFNINQETIINTWIVLAILLVLGIVTHAIITYTSGTARYMVCDVINTMRTMTTQTLGFFKHIHFSFVTALLIYIIICNCLSLFPGLQEPTKDINTTLALGLLSFCYVQWFAIAAQGLWAYIKDYFAPFFIMLPLNIIGKIATIVSISFRLFGNIFGGATITHMYFSLLYGSTLLQLGALFSGFNLLMQLFFGIFEGCIQAFVFAMLTLTYLATAITQEQD
jgi:F-type H+-transporting ATPase subunit a